MNALTGADVGVGERLFHTLDPTTRGYELEGRRYLLTDTVGFIRKLPHQLVEAFKATLEETTLADLLLHVIDGSQGEEAIGEAVAAVESVLEEIGAGERPRLVVLNKIDLLDEDERRELRIAHPDAVLVSAASGEGLDELRAASRRRSATASPRWSCSSPTSTATGSPSCTSSPATSSATTARTACMSAPWCRLPSPSASPSFAVRAHRRLTGAALRWAARWRSSSSAASTPGPCSRPARTTAMRGSTSTQPRTARFGPGERLSVGTGLAVAIPVGHAGLVVPRSGLALRHGIALVNAPGVIDSGYRGELRVLLLNTDRSAEFKISAGDRVAQLLLDPGRHAAAGRGGLARRVRPRDGRLRLQRSLGRRGGALRRARGRE